jgi:hypothetical protein
MGFLAMRGGELSWHDGYGREVFTAALEPESQALYRQSGSINASSRGNLLVVSLGRELAAFNTLARSDGQSTPVAWRATLGSNFDYQNGYVDELSRASALRPGSFRAPRTMFDGKWIGVIGPMTSRGCVFQDQRRLLCVDPLSGEVLWSRNDVPPGCDLFGDERYVLAAPMGSEKAKAYSTIDGRALGEVAVPPWEEQLTTRGRHVIRWHTLESGRVELAAIDALSQEVAWRHEFAEGAGVDIDRDRYVAVVEPAGRAAIIDADSGAILLEQPLPRQTGVEGVHLLAGAESFVLVAENPAARNADREVRGLMGGDSPVVDGHVVVIDRPSGAMKWNRPATVLRQALLLSQPPDVPFITFVGTLVSRSPGDGRDTTTMLLMDKATGRTLYRSDDLPQTGAGYCMVHMTDAEKREVTVDMAGRSLLLQFTEGRRPPEPPAMAEVESGASKASGGLIGILRNLGG